MTIEDARLKEIENYGHPSEEVWEMATELLRLRQDGREVESRIQHERLMSRVMGVEDGASAFDSAVKDLHALIEDNWIAQCRDHACGCDEWPECTHTLNASTMREKAISIETGQPLPPAPEGGPK